MSDQSECVQDRKPAGDAPLVLLPGLLCDATIWAAQVTAFPGRPVVVVDYGVCTSLEAMAEAALSQAGDRFALVGHSMGARVALEMMRMAADRVERLALVSTGVHPAGPDEPAKRQGLIDLARREGMAALSEAWLPPMVHPDRRADEALMAPLRAMVERQELARFEGQVAALLGRRNARPLLGAIRCPLLVAVGRQDSWSPPSQHEEIAAGAPQAVLRVLEDSGHMAPAEVPDALNTALAAWLSV